MQAYEQSFLFKGVALKKAVLLRNSFHLLATRVLSDSFGSLAHSMLRELSWQDETNCCLDFTRADRVPVVVLCETRCFTSDLSEDIVDEGIHDRHCLAGDADIGMYLLQHLVDVDAVRLLSCLLSFRLRYILLRYFLVSFYHFDTLSIREYDR